MSPGKWNYHPRRRSVVALWRRARARFPELDQPVTWADVESIAKAARVKIRFCHLPAGRSGMLVRVGDDVFMYLSKLLRGGERTWVAMHEFGHLWGDDPGEMCAFDDEGEKSPNEEFCERFAWYCVDPGAREFLHRWREEAF